MVTLQETLQGTLNAAFLGLVEAAPVQLHCVAVAATQRLQQARFRRRVWGLGSRARV